MKKLVLLLVIVSMLTVAFSSVAFADGHLNPSEICTEVVEPLVLEETGLELTHGGCMQVLQTATRGRSGLNVTAAAAGICQNAAPGDRGAECIELVRTAIYDFISELG